MADEFITENLKCDQASLIGKRFEYLVVLAFVGKLRQGRDRKYFWRCKCDCGNIKNIPRSNLVSGNSGSCGCKNSWVRGLRRSHKESHGRHGPGTTEYVSWRKIRERCYNEKCPEYRSYGAVGIKMCDRWNYGENGMMGFECFLLDMGRKPSNRFSIDRYPNGAGNYEPGNCRWATAKQQARNINTNVYVEIEGQKKLLIDLSDQYGLPAEAVRKRIRRGWDVKRAVETPLMANKYVFKDGSRA